jgi:hypothetical protein
MEMLTGFFSCPVDPILVHLQQAPGTCTAAYFTTLYRITIQSCNSGSVFCYSIIIDLHHVN